MPNSPQIEKTPPSKETSFSYSNIPAESPNYQRDMKKVALTWVDRGYAVIPIKVTRAANGDLKKEPHILWKNGAVNYQEIKPTREEVTSWWNQWPNALVAIIGGHGGLVCFDIDDPVLAAKLEPKFINHTRIEKSKKSGKIHIWLKEREYSKSGVLIPGVADLKGHKAYFLAAPSNHYYLLNPSVTEPMEVPNYDTAREYVYGLLKHEGYEPPNESSKILLPPQGEKITEGEGRNNLLASVAGSLRRKGADEKTILAAIRGVNIEKCDPPWRMKRWKRLPSLSQATSPVKKGRSIRK